MGRRFQSKEPEPGPVQSFGTDYDAELIAAMEANAPEPDFAPGETVMGQEEIDAAKAYQAGQETGDSPGFSFGGPVSDEDSLALQENLAPTFTGLGPDPGFTPDLDHEYPPEELTSDGIPTDPQAQSQILTTDLSQEQQAANAQKAAEAENLATGMIPYQEQLAALRGELEALDVPADPLLESSKEHLTEIAKRKSENVTRLETALSDYKKPFESYWQSASTGQKIMGAIALALGTIGGGLTGTGRNLAAEMIVKQVRDDARLKRTDRQGRYNASKENFEKMRRTIGDDEAAEQARIAAGLQKAQQQVGIYKLKVADIGTRAKLTDLEARLGLKAREYSQKALKEMNKNNPFRLFGVDAQGNRRKDARYLTKAQGGGQGGIPAAPFATDTQGVQLGGENLKRYVQSENGWKAVLDMQAALRRGESAFDPTSLAGELFPTAYTDAAKRAVEYYGRIVSGAAIGSQEQGQFAAQLPGYREQLYQDWMAENGDDIVAGLTKSGGDFGQRLHNFGNFFQGISENLTGARFAGGAEGLTTIRKRKQP